MENQRAVYEDANAVRNDSTGAGRRQTRLRSLSRMNNFSAGEARAESIEATDFPNPREFP